MRVVFTLQAKGAVSAAMSAAAAPIGASSRAYGLSSSATAPSTPAVTTTTRSHGRKSAAWDIRTTDHQVVPSTTTAATMRAQTAPRRSQRSHAPTPTRPPIAGASATE